MIASAVTVLKYHDGRVDLTWWGTIILMEFLLLLMLLVVVSITNDR